MRFPVPSGKDTPALRPFGLPSDNPLSEAHIVILLMFSMVDCGSPVILDGTGFLPEIYFRPLAENPATRIHRDKRAIPIPSQIGFRKEVKSREKKWSNEVTLILKNYQTNWIMSRETSFTDLPWNIQQESRKRYTRMLFPRHNSNEPYEYCTENCRMELALTLKPSSHRGMVFYPFNVSP